VTPEEAREQELTEYERLLEHKAYAQRMSRWYRRWRMFFWVGRNVALLCSSASAATFFVDDEIGRKALMVIIPVLILLATIGLAGVLYEEQYRPKPPPGWPEDLP